MSAFYDKIKSFKEQLLVKNKKVVQTVVLEKPSFTSHLLATFSLFSGVFDLTTLFNLDSIELIVKENPSGFISFSMFVLFRVSIMLSVICLQYLSVQSVKHRPLGRDVRTGALAPNLLKIIIPLKIKNYSLKFYYFKEKY